MKPITLPDGRKFKSKTAVCLAYGISPSCADYRIANNIVPFGEFRPFERAKRGEHGGGNLNKPCEWRGVSYPSVTAAAAAQGITVSGMSRRLKRERERAAKKAAKEKKEKSGDGK